MIRLFNPKRLKPVIEVADTELERLDSCPHCGQACKTVVAVPPFGIDACQSCGLYFTNPRVEENEIIKYYGLDYCESFSPASGVCRFDDHYLEQLSIISRLSKGRTFLEIGAGRARFSCLASIHGYDVTVNELVPESVSCLKEFNVKIHHGNVENDSFPRDSFDIVAMLHVYEHLYDTRKMASTVHNILAPGGIFVVAIPNVFSIDACFNMECRNRTLSLPFHNFHFSDSFFVKLMKENGFILAATNHNPPALISAQIKRMFGLRKQDDSCQGLQNGPGSGTASVAGFLLKRLRGLVSLWFPGEQLEFYFRRN